MIRRPPRSTHCISSAASDVYKRQILHIYNFSLYPLDQQNNSSVIGKPKEINGGQEMRYEAGFEIMKHMKGSLLNKVSPDKSPFLESTLFNSKHSKLLGNVIAYESKKAVRDKAGKVIYTSEALEKMEDSLIEAAGRRLAIQKEKSQEQKERARNLARQLRGKPRPLELDLITWANDCKPKKENTNTDIVKEGVAKIIAREDGSKNNDKINSKIPGDKVVNSSCGTVEKSSVSEVKFDAKGFKNFLSWRSSAHNHDSEENNVKDLLIQSNTEAIEVNIVVAKKAPKCAFDGWLTSCADKKRDYSEGANSSKKPSAKKPKLCVWRDTEM
eukprot:TRINITY_DN1756_c0_g2_i2.p1 TRINITY_DN1756_c0_g2~~TRINITY_DN1756_c0_g2_i2.p1  ORF type:complete len:337 (+),score=109.33 TRINITY_DN1756_c0_g2_i2:29-1012(+)